MAIMALPRLGPRKAANAMARIKNGYRVGHAPDQGIEQPAQIARCQPQRHADRKRNSNGNDAGHQRRACSKGDPCQNVPAKIVGAEPVRRGGFIAHQGPALRRRIVGRNQWREDRERDKECNDGQPKDCAFTAEKPAQRAAKGCFDTLACRDQLCIDDDVGHVFSCAAVD
jgi:hypothetical protein